MVKICAGLDAGKEFHWLAVVDDTGQNILSRRVENSEEDITQAIDEVVRLGPNRTWAVDMPGGVASLLLTLLWQRGEKVLFVPGMTVNRSRDTYPGEAKTDERDAYVIADQARMRSGLRELRPSEDIMAELALLVSHRRDLVADQTRAIARLRDTMVSVFPGLERVLDFKSKGALLLVGRYQTPGQVRRAGIKRVEAYLRAQGAVKAAELASKAVAAGQAQTVKLPAEDVAARIVSDLSVELMKLKDRIAAIDAELEHRFFSHPQARTLMSFPGIGTVLGAEFLVEVGDLSAFSGPDSLAAYAGLVPVARDSGKRVGNMRRMRGGNKVLKKMFYQASFASLKASPESRAFYDRKRAEGKKHHQALLALSRRRVNVLWAMLRDDTTFRSAAA